MLTKITSDISVWQASCSTAVVLRYKQRSELGLN